jgi:hypothetical protein
LRRIISSFSIAVLLSFILFVLGAFGQSASTIEQLEIAFWPEYDRSVVLVIYRILLAEDAVLPTQISLPIPADVGEPHATAWQDATGELIVAQYERLVMGNWATITLETESRFAVIEFYQAIDFNAAQRNVSFSWPGGYSAGVLTYEILEPVDASNFVINPPEDSSAPGAFGLNQFRADLGTLLPTSEFTIEFSYQKSSDTLSVDAVSTPIPIPTTSPVMPTGGTPDIAELIPWIVGGVGGLLLLVAAVLFIRYRGEQTRVKPSGKPKRRRRPADDKSREVEASPVFCHNCGAKASASDFYCRRCGTQLRR